MKRFLLFALIGLSVCTLYAQTKTKVACVGNSVTYGYGIENREENSYPAQLGRLLGNAYQVENFGKSGATLLNLGHRPYIQQDEYKQAIRFAADLVIIHLGLNDTDPRNWSHHRNHFIPDYTHLIGAFREATPTCKIWICRLSPIFEQHSRFISGTRDWYWQIQQEIETIAANNDVQLIDLQKPLYARPDLFPDAIHPTAEGASILANTIYAALTGNYGGLQMPTIYTDHMILQRNRSGHSAAYLTFDYAEGMHTFYVRSKYRYSIPPLPKLILPNGQICVKAPEVTQPCMVRYGWQPFTRANLVNGQQFPASTFRTETQPDALRMH